MEENFLFKCQAQWGLRDTDCYFQGSSESG